MNAPLLKSAVGRRGFLRVFALAPMVAKAATDKAIADVTGVNISGVGGSNAAPGNGPPIGGSGSVGTAMTTTERVSSFFKLLRKNGGLPQFELEKIRRDNRAVYALDPDIAALKSFSMSVKVQMQRERNIERTVEGQIHYQTYTAAVDRFRQRHGFWLWW